MSFSLLKLSDLACSSLNSAKASNVKIPRYLQLSISLNDKKANSSSAKGNLLCAKYKTVPQSIWASSGNCIWDFTTSSSNNISIVDSSYTDEATFKTAMSGVYLYYELAEPTTEQGTPYSENLVIDDFGSMDFDSDVPQGALIFYPVDYKAYIDTLYKYTDGTPSNIALKSDLQPLSDKDTQLLNAVGGTLRQCLCVKESLDFDNTAVVDLGTLTWGLTSYGFWRVQSLIADMKAPTINTKPKWLCSKYDISTIIYDAGDFPDLTINEDNAVATIRLKDTSLNSLTADQFKAAMNGVLLAYEKASE